MTKIRWAELIRTAPDAPGVYSVWAGSQVLYIGTSARSIKLRLLNHDKRPEFMRMGATEVRYMCCNFGRKKTEEFLIWRWRPPLCAHIPNEYYRGQDWLKANSIIGRDVCFDQGSQEWVTIPRKTRFIPNETIN